MRRTGNLFHLRIIVEAVTAAEREHAQTTWGVKTLSSEDIIDCNFFTGSEDITYQTAFDQPEGSVKVIKSNFSLADAYGERRKNSRGVEINKKNEVISKRVH